MEELIGLLRFGADGWGDELLAGTWLTIRLALATVPIGLVLGLVIALMKNTESRPMQFVGNAFTTVFRGLPELLTLFIVYYGGQILLQKVVALFSDSYVEVSSFAAGMVALGVVFAAYSSEVFLAALRAISTGQIEASRALGLSRWLTLRLVIIPQLWRYALPGLGNLWLVLLKETSLVSIIALDDLLRQTKVAVGATKEPFFFYLVACLIYLALSMISSIGLVALERRSNRGQRRVGA